MTSLRLRDGIAKYADLAMLLAYAGNSDPFEAPTHVMVLDNAGGRAEWGLESLDHVFVGITTFQSPAMERPAFVCVSEEGQVWFHLKDRIIEDIADAGLFKPASAKLGYLGGIRQLGDTLFVFGWGGQVYRRAGPDIWQHFDEGLIDDEARGIDVSDLCLTGQIFYAVTRMGGPGRIYGRKGDVWQRLDNPSGEWLNAMTVAGDGSVWICGRGGTVLNGDATRGFRSVGDPGCREEFLSIAFHRDTLWLASATALHVLREGRLVKVATGLSPELRSAGRLQVIDDVLWSFGADEVLRFDGERWVRFVWPGGERSSEADALDDQALIEIAKARADEKGVPVDLDGL